MLFALLFTFVLNIFLVLLLAASHVPIVLDFGSGTIRVGVDDTFVDSPRVANHNGKRPIDALSIEATEQNVALKRARSLSFARTFLFTSSFKSMCMSIVCLCECCYFYMPLLMYAVGGIYRCTRFGLFARNYCASNACCFSCEISVARY